MATYLHEVAGVVTVWRLICDWVALYGAERLYAALGWRILNEAYRGGPTVAVMNKAQQQNEHRSKRVMAAWKTRSTFLLSHQTVRIGKATPRRILRERQQPRALPMLRDALTMSATRPKLPEARVSTVVARVVCTILHDKAAFKTDVCAVAGTVGAQ